MNCNLFGTLDFIGESFEREINESWSLLYIKRPFFPEIQLSKSHSSNSTDEKQSLVYLWYERSQSQRLDYLREYFAHFSKHLRD